MSKIPVAKFGLKASSWFSWGLKFGFAILFITYLLIHAIALGIQEKDLGVVVSELGREFYDPLRTAQEVSIEAQNNPSEGFFSSLWTYWSLYFALYKIYLWFSVILRFIINPFLKDAIPLVIRLFFVVFIFYTIQVLYMTYILDLNINLPFIATWDIIKGLIKILAG